MNQTSSASSSQSYQIPSHTVSVETEIKRSRFIAQVAWTENQAAAKSFIISVKQQYPDARHHCWAYIACPPNGTNAIRFSDDGEPQGTAGKPILNVLQHSGIGEIICVVSRYFGGIKLGAGGLVRAYSSSAKAALDEVTTEVKVTRCQLQLIFAYAAESEVRYQLEQWGANVIETQYMQQIEMQISLAEENRKQFIQQLDSLQYRMGKEIQINAV